MSTFDDGPPPPPPPPDDAPPPPPPPDGPPPPPPDEPPGPPPGPPPDEFPTSAMPPVGGPPPVAAAASTTPDWVKPVAIAAAIALIIAIVVAVSSGGDKKEAAGGGEIFLQPISEPGPDVFTPNVATPLPPNTFPTTTVGPTATTAPGGKLAITARSGGAKGLYGGTLDQSLCDKQGMIDFLNQNPSKKAAWASVQGISPSDVPAYINSLAEVVLTSPTRVTNHGYKNGKATSFQAILQEKTAVLVDNHAFPRARCACGNPLTPAVAVPTTPVYKGTPWPGFTPTNVTVINQTTTIINNITVINIVTGDTINITINNFTPGGGGGTGGTTPNTTRNTTVPPTTIKTGSGTFHLTNVEVKNPNQQNWTVHENEGGKGTAHAAYDPNTGDYDWTVLQTVDPAGSDITFGGSAKGNVAIDINVYVQEGDAVLTPADNAQRAVNCYDSANGCTAHKTATLTVPNSVTRFVLKFAMGYAVDVLYTYER